MDWNLAIKRNRTDLAKIVAGLFVLAGWVPGGDKPTFLRRAVCCELSRLLTVSEAALRRLIMIVMVARKYDGAKSRNASSNELPDFTSFGPGSGSRAPVFKLVDPRRPVRFVEEADWYGETSGGPEPRIWTLEVPLPLVANALQQAQGEGRREAQGEGRGEKRGENFERSDDSAEALVERMNSANLLRRLEALDRALKSLPRQAKRMARLIGKSRAAPSGVGRVELIRAGAPPGYREAPKHEADHLLQECHGLVCYLRGIP